MHIPDTLIFSFFPQYTATKFCKTMIPYSSVVWFYYDWCDHRTGEDYGRATKLRRSELKMLPMERCWTWGMHRSNILCCYKLCYQNLKITPSSVVLVHFDYKFWPISRTTVRYPLTHTLISGDSRGLTKILLLELFKHDVLGDCVFNFFLSPNTRRLLSPRNF